ncbi:MAG: polyprenyl synthetase family protein [Deinococcales bacterium]
MSMTVALAVELLHSASLLHDDLIDDADTRRGKEAAFRRYGNIVSVMSGDFMLAKVLSLLARSKSPEFTQLMSQTAADICEAEVLQFQMASLETYSFENYYRIISGKTAVLLAAALEGVAILAGQEEAREPLRTYAMAYGRAFQMQDDYLDLLGESEKLGKPIGGDLKEGKATYAVLKLILEEDVTEARAILRRHASQEADVLRMRDLVISKAIDQAAKAAIITEAQKAKEALAHFPKSRAKVILLELADREIHRAK